MAFCPTSAALFFGNVLAYTDRDHVLVNIPSEPASADFIQVSNSDKTSVPYQLDVITIGSLSLLYVGLDRRLGDEDNTTPAQPLSRMSASAHRPLTAIWSTGVDGLQRCVLAHA